MSSAPNGRPAARTDRRATRRQETKNEIIAAAWDLVREHGLAGLAMRDLGERVGMKAQSVYSYFESKHEIYDAMFHEGYVAFAAATAEAGDGSGAEKLAPGTQTVLHVLAHRFFEFCISDPARYQLLFQRTIPDFVPSSESYAVAEAAYAEMEGVLATVGVTDPQMIDLWTATLTGLSDQQISNDPGGERWERIIDRAIDIFICGIDSSNSEPIPGRKQP